jgi:uncharacterized lipoprotein YddW (UPF0748 family)
MRRLLASAVPLLLAGCAVPNRPGASIDEVPAPARSEMRGLWVATVGNIDWPSRRGLSEKQQRKELVGILDRAAKIGFNTIVLQVRPAADALYASELEPWAAWLTGTQGESPGYDPLAFAITEAHARGLQLHAWINPFRAGNTADTAVLSPSHVFHARRDLVRVYGSNLWMDPGDPETHERSIRAIRDIVTRYDVDGIHADDYFYPYQISDSLQRVVPFPDDSTYARYGAGQDRDDWRRANIDRFVERMYRTVHEVKPNVVVGLSPFGIWRPGNPESVRGLDAFSTIYADSRKWLQEGWMDYFVPQLYWPIGAPQQSFPALLDWWNAQSTAGRYVWPGLAAYRVQNGSANAFSLDEIPAQMRIVRERLKVPGEVLFNTKSTLYRLDGLIGETVGREVYGAPAVVPAYSWLDSIAPRPPRIAVDGRTLGLVSPDAVRWWIVRAHLPTHWTWTGRKGQQWINRAYLAANPVRLETGPDRVLVQAVDAAGNQSAVAEWRRP